MPLEVTGEVILYHKLYFSFIYSQHYKYLTVEDGKGSPKNGLSMIRRWMEDSDCQSVPHDSFTDGLTPSERLFKNLPAFSMCLEWQILFSPGVLLSFHSSSTSSGTYSRLYKRRIEI